MLFLNFTFTSKELTFIKSKTEHLLLGAMNIPPVLMFRIGTKQLLVGLVLLYHIMNVSSLIAAKPIFDK